MRARLLVTAAALCVAPLTNVGAAQTTEYACGRSCLIRHVDDYLAALVAHDPAKLVLAPKARVTENAAPLALGDGLWGTISDPGTYRIYFTDPKTQTGALFAIIKENGLPSLLTLRIKVQNDQLSEVESWVTREGGSSLFAPTRNKSDPIWSAVVPPAERMKDQKLKKVAESYFDGIEQNTGKDIPFANDARRFENGVATTSGTPGRHVMTGPEGSVDFGALNIREQFMRGGMAYGSIRPRRYAVIDGEHGVVLAYVGFNTPGTAKGVQVRGVGFVPVTNNKNRHPRSVEVAEAFKIVNGQIVLIEAQMVDIPYKLPDGWSR
jgi:hypothetical protein